MGRSFGVYVVLATQRSEKDILDSVRPNITVPIILRQPSEYMNDLFLYKGAAKDGYDSTSIPPSTKPHYETAGIGYTIDEKGQPTKFRSAFVGREDIGRLIREFRALDGLGMNPGEFKKIADEADATKAAFADTLADEDDDGDFSITEERVLPELPDFNLDEF